MPDPADILDDAADAIDRFGWVQGFYGNEEAGFCMRGAMHYAFYRKNPTPKMVRIAPGSTVVVKAAELAREGIPVAITYWNDEQGRTKDQVTTALRMAAKRARGVEA